ncbi:MAG: hypothetical protein AAFR96_06540 [Planctomycetota bacterium]
MSQMGMSMPGGRRKRAGGPDVYTGLLFMAVLALGAATTLMYFAAVQVGPDGNPIGEQQPNRIQLAR